MNPGFVVMKRREGSCIITCVRLGDWRPRIFRTREEAEAFAADISGWTTWVEANHELHPDDVLPFAQCRVCSEYVPDSVRHAVFEEEGHTLSPGAVCAQCLPTFGFHTYASLDELGEEMGWLPDTTDEKEGRR